MLHFRMDYKCAVCDNKTSWYIMPLNEKVISGDLIRSNTKFYIQCKKCGQTYLLKLSMQRLEKKVK